MNFKKVVIFIENENYLILLILSIKSVENRRIYKKRLRFFGSSESFSEGFSNLRFGNLSFIFIQRSCMVNKCF